MRWLSLLGQFDPLDDEDGVVFRGGGATTEGLPPDSGQLIYEKYFSGGQIEAKVRFLGSTEGAGLSFILFFNPETRFFVNALLGGNSLCSVNSFAGEGWTPHGAYGSGAQLKPDVDYELFIKAIGSRVSMRLNGVDVLTTNLPFVLPRSQTGIWAISPHDIEVREVRIEAVRPMVFVVMQFTPEYNLLYEDVIRPVAEELGFSVVRGDERSGPGLIIADIERDIQESNLIVAEISSANPNVFWEVGYAHALRKPTILIAERDIQLPFDVSAFRVLFYEDTIGGKKRVEEGLRRHIEAIGPLWRPV